MGVARALRLAASHQSLRLTSSLPSSITTFTFSARMRWDTTTVTRRILEMGNAAWDDTLKFLCTADPWVIFRDEANTDAHLASYDPAANTWHWIACRIDTGATPTAKIWVAPDGGGVTSATGSPTGIASALVELHIVGETTGSQVDVSEVKMWLSALTDGEVLAERDYVVPQKAGVWAWYGMDSDTLATCLTDDSGNGHTLTAPTTPTVIAGAGTTWDAGATGNPVPMGFVVE